MTIHTLIENAPYVAFGLVSAMLLIPRARFIRFFVALFAGLQLTVALMTSHDQTSIIWMAVLLGLALLIMIGDLVASRRVRLSREEQSMVATLLHRVGRTRARHFIDQGFWLNGRTGDVLIREGEAVRHLYFLSEGEARVVVAGKQVGHCRAGEPVGQLALFTNETAGATVVLAGPARFWCAPIERLEPYLDAHAALRRAIERNVSTGVATAGAPQEQPLPDTGAAPVSI